jgi:hypothetical protein
VQQGTREPDESVDATIEQELLDGLLSPAIWTAFAERSRAVIVALRDWLDERFSSRDMRVAAYGAAAKGNTLLNAAGVVASEIAVVADGSVAKQGKFLPGTRIPVVAPAELGEANATDILILPWNLADEIVPILGEIVPGARRWVAVPGMTLIEP